MLDIENLKKVPSSIEAEKSVLGGYRGQRDRWCRC